MDQFGELDKQIDAIFDDIKTKVKDLSVPKSSIPNTVQSGMQNLTRKRYDPNWLKKLRQTHNVYERYDTLNKFSKKFIAELMEAVDTSSIDQVIDQYKQRLKGIMRMFMSSPKSQNPYASGFQMHNQWQPPEPEPQKSSDSSFQVSNQWAPQQYSYQYNPQQSSQVQMPSETMPVNNPAQSQPETPMKRTKKPRTPKPVAQEVTPTPEAPAQPEIQPQTPSQNDDDALARKGHAIVNAIHIKGDDITDDDIKALGRKGDYDMSEDSPEDRANYIKIAQDYNKKLAASNPAAPVPEKRKRGRKPKNVNPSAEIPKASNSESQPTQQITPQADEAILKNMLPEDFKKFIFDNDPELADAYDSREWWKPSLRDELIASYLSFKKGKEAKTESALKKIIKMYVEKLSNHSV